MLTPGPGNSEVTYLLGPLFLVTLSSEEWRSVLPLNRLRTLNLQEHRWLEKSTDEASLAHLTLSVVFLGNVEIVQWTPKTSLRNEGSWCFWNNNAKFSDYNCYSTGLKKGLCLLQFAHIWETFLKIFHLKPLMKMRTETETCKNTSFNKHQEVQCSFIEVLHSSLQQTYYLL